MYLCKYGVMVKNVRNKEQKVPLRGRNNDNENIFDEKIILR
jgi:hypothetical protein